MKRSDDFYAAVRQTLAKIKQSGLFKQERIINSPQGSTVQYGKGEFGSGNGQLAINLCANNYLGLSAHPEVIQAAHDALDKCGFGMSSVRFICGTQEPHKQLERRLAEFLGTEDTILYGSAFDANGGLFEPLFDESDAIISDALNHASIIDGIRLCKARRYRYKNNDIADLCERLKEARDGGARHMLVFTDGVFSMDGTIVCLGQIRDLCDKFGALLGIDDCHATGFLGARGRGSHEHNGVFGKIDIITGTLGKALGGASGGFTSGRKEVIELLRQRSRPYLFSNTLAPAIVGASLRVLDILERDTGLRDTLEDNAQYFRAGLKQLGFDLKPGNHPIIPIMVYDAKRAQQLSQQLLALGVYVIGFCYPVVPQDQARIRVQVSALHSRNELNQALDAFKQAGRALGMIK